MQQLGNAIDFGDAITLYKKCEWMLVVHHLLVQFYWMDTASYVNVIDYVQIMTTGNAIDFGDLTVGRVDGYGASNGHGGLG